MTRPELSGQAADDAELPVDTQEGDDRVRDALLEIADEPERRGAGS